jgi:pimeloyl-ACP methyl ester carboxylesterase
MALRGINLLAATTVVAEIGDLKRFASAPQLMAYLGVVPSEHSSGSLRRWTMNDGRWVIAPGAGHDVHSENPRVIIDSVVQLLERAGFE